MRGRNCRKLVGEDADEVRVKAALFLLEHYCTASIRYISRHSQNANSNLQLLRQQHLKYAVPSRSPC